MEKQTKSAREILQDYRGPKIRIMEVCGTHTHEIFRLGIRGLLSPDIRLISGPGCPVCVTPVDFIDEALYLALEKGVTICTFGDLVRVPGTKMSLAGARARGAVVKVFFTSGTTGYPKMALHSYMYAIGHIPTARYASCRWALKPPLPPPAWPCRRQSRKDLRTSRS